MSDSLMPGPVRSSAADTEEGGGESDPDRVITNARAAEDRDGLLNSSELEALFSASPRAFSAYDLGLSRYRSGASPSQLSSTSPEIAHSPQDIPIYGPLNGMKDPSQPGFHEPAYTSYTHYWKSVLGASFPGFT